MMDSIQRWKTFDPWKPEELELFYWAYTNYGTQWDLVAASLPGRTHEMLQLLYEHAQRVLNLPAFEGNLIRFKNIIEHFQRKSVYLKGKGVMVSPDDDEGPIGVITEIQPSGRFGRGYLEQPRSASPVHGAAFEEDPLIHLSDSAEGPIGVSNETPPSRSFGHGYFQQPSPVSPMHGAAFEEDPLIHLSDSDEGVEFDEADYGLLLESSEFTIVTSEVAEGKSDDEDFSTINGAQEIANSDSEIDNSQPGEIACPGDNNNNTEVGNGLTEAAESGYGVQHGDVLCDSTGNPEEDNNGVKTYSEADNLAQDAALSAS